MPMKTETRASVLSWIARLKARNDEQITECVRRIEEILNRREYIPILSESDGLSLVQELKKPTIGGLKRWFYGTQDLMELRLRYGVPSGVSVSTPLASTPVIAQDVTPTVIHEEAPTVTTTPKANEVKEQSESSTLIRESKARERLMERFPKSVRQMAAVVTKRTLSVCSQLKDSIPSGVHEKAKSFWKELSEEDSDKWYHGCIRAIVGVFVIMGLFILVCKFPEVCSVLCGFGSSIFGGMVWIMSMACQCVYWIFSLQGMGLTGASYVWQFMVSSGISIVTTMSTLVTFNTSTQYPDESIPMMTIFDGYEGALVDIRFNTRNLTQEDHNTLLHIDEQVKYYSKHMPVFLLADSATLGPKKFRRLPNGKQDKTPEEVKLHDWIDELLERIKYLEAQSRKSETKEDPTAMAVVSGIAGAAICVVITTVSSLVTSMVQSGLAFFMPVVLGTARGLGH